MKDTLESLAVLVFGVVIGAFGFALIVALWVLLIATYGAFFGVLAAGAYWAFKLLAGML